MSMQVRTFPTTDVDAINIHLVADGRVLTMIAKGRSEKRYYQQWPASDVRHGGKSDDQGDTMNDRLTEVVGKAAVDTCAQR